MAVRHEGEWRPSAKRSDTPAKATVPGPKALFRVYDARGMATADLVNLADERPRAGEPLTPRHPANERSRSLAADDVSGVELLLETHWSDGGARVEPQDIAALRARCEADEARLDAGVKRLRNPHRYHVSLSERLWRLRQANT